jgi:hypothetical protein
MNYLRFDFLLIPSLTRPRPRNTIPRLRKMRGSVPLDVLRSAPVTAMIWLRGVSAGDCAGGTGVGLPSGVGVGLPSGVGVGVTSASGVPVPGVAGGVVMIVPVTVGVGVSVPIPGVVGGVVMTVPVIVGVAVTGVEVGVS